MDIGMKKIILLFPLILTTGCVDQSFFVKQNISYDQYERQYVGCATKATQNVPTNTQVAWAPYVGIYSTDTNAALRQKNFDICMRDGGYQEVTLPYCTGDALKQAQAQASEPKNLKRKMKINSGSCYISTGSGQPYLYTPLSQSE